MTALRGIVRTGLTAVRLQPLRSLVSALCLFLVLTPYLAATGLSTGLQRDAEASIQGGADLYVSGEELGRRVPVPLSVLPALRKVPGVLRAVPRIVGAIRLGGNDEPAVVVGVPASSAPSQTRLVEGRLYRDGPSRELVVGTELARRLHLQVGSRIPPFYRNEEGERICEVVGVFTADASLWQSRLVLTSFQTASEIFGRRDVAGDVLVYCERDKEEEVQAAVQRLFLTGAAGGGIRGRVRSRADLEALLPGGVSHKSGVFSLHYMLAFVVAGMVLLVSSGIGLPERRREIGILKATGWQTDEILLRSFVESSVISAGAASISLIAAWVWLDLLNGFGIAAMFMGGVSWVPSFKVPFSLAPLPALLGFFFSWVILTGGTLAAAWRAASIAPREAMR